MSAALERVDPMVALARAQDAVDELLALELTGRSDDELLEYGREKERLARRLSALDHRFVGELIARDLPGRNSVRPVAFLRGLLRLDPHEAGGRIRAAEAAGPRRALTGERLPAIYPEVAAAQEAGAISDKHAWLIVTTIEKLPDEIQAEHGEQIEKDLIGYANRFDPHHLARIAKRLRYCYDQDGGFNEVDYRNKVRELTITPRPDGSSAIKGEATAELTEFLLTTIDALGKPVPEVDGVKDPRTAAQRRHDALLDALKINVRARALPSIAGVTATVVLTMTAEDFEARNGLARTGHGALIPVPEAIRMTAGEYRLMSVVIDRTKGITAYSSTARLFGETQRLAGPPLTAAAPSRLPGTTRLVRAGPSRRLRRRRTHPSRLRGVGLPTTQQHRQETGLANRNDQRPSRLDSAQMDRPRTGTRYNDLHRTELRGAARSSRARLREPVQD